MGRASVKSGVSKRTGSIPKSVFESKLPALLCRTKNSYDHFFYDLYYWRRVPEAEYNRWVDRCEALDKRIDLCLHKKGHIIGYITNWRDRPVEISLSQLSDKRLDGLRKLLRGGFRDWRISLSVWSALTKGKHLGGILIDCDGLIITRGLAAYFPFATPVTKKMIEEANHARSPSGLKKKKSVK
jgi:hypothetical protein